MKITRAYFKYTLRQCRAHNETHKADKLAKQLLGKDDRQFWKEVNKLKGGSSSTFAFSVDNASGQKEICDLWKKHYQNILNSSNDTQLKKVVMDKLKLCTSHDNPFTPTEVAAVIKRMKNGKACGRDGLQSEHFKYCDDRISVLLNLF